MRFNTISPVHRGSYRVAMGARTLMGSALTEVDQRYPVLHPSGTVVTARRPFLVRNTEPTPGLCTRGSGRECDMAAGVFRLSVSPAGVNHGLIHLGWVEKSVLACLAGMFAVAGLLCGEVFNQIAIGQDAGVFDFAGEYETVASFTAWSNLRLQSPNWVVIHTGTLFQPRVSIDPLGRVGIGTGTPDALLTVAGTLCFGGFGIQDADEWPNVWWMRDEANGWDEGLIKVSSAHGVFGRSGFGIHMHKNRHFGFYSSGWDPLVDIEGGTGRMYIKGCVGIGTTDPTERLSVNGSIRAKEVIVEATGWPDHVLAKDHSLQSLSDVERVIEQHGHLPGIPSAQEISEKGIPIGDMQAKLLAKIEELTLHVIRQEKEIQALRIQLARCHHPQE